MTLGDSVMWLIGAAIAAAGMQVYIIWGTVRRFSSLTITISPPKQAFPRNGGEKNYLEHLFPTPPRLITSIYAAHAVLLAYAAGNALVFAEYSLASFGCPPSDNSASLLSPVRVGAALALTFVVLLHGLHIPWGLRLQNALGGLKLLILLFVIGTGVAALAGHVQPDVPRPGNYDTWKGLWAGSRTNGSVICACLYNVGFLQYYPLSTADRHAGHLVVRWLLECKLRPLGDAQPSTHVAHRGSPRARNRDCRVSAVQRRIFRGGE